MEFTKEELEYIKETAQNEYKANLFNEAVKKEVERLRTKRSFWDKVFPFKIIIVRK